MNFGFETQFDEGDEFATVSHLMEQARLLGLETPEEAFGISEDLEAEQLIAFAAELKASIEAEQERLKAEEAKRNSIPPCYIGPYADGWCTICGGRQP